MSLKQSILDIIESVKKENAFTSKFDLEVPGDLLNKSTQEIVDGLVKKFDGDEELALTAIKKHLETREDGYKDKNPQIVAAKDKLEKIIEAKKEAVEVDINNDTNFEQNDANDIKTALEIENSGLKEWSNYPDDYNPRLNPYENDDEDYNNALEDLTTGYAVLLSKDEQGQPLIDRHGYALDPKYGLLYASEYDDWTSNNVLSSEEGERSVFFTKEEAEQFANQFKQKYPASEYTVVEVYSDDISNPENWHEDAEDALPYDKYKEDQYWSKADYDYENSKYESTSPSRFRTMFQKILAEKGYDRNFKNAHEPSKVFVDRDASKVKQMKAYVTNGIHPNMDYDKPYWRYITPQGEKMVFVLDGIDDESKIGANMPNVYVRPVTVIRTSSGRWIKKQGERQPLPVNIFLDIIHSDLNKEIYDNVVRSDGEDPDDWLDKIDASEENRKASYSRWYEKNKEDLQLDDYDRITAQKIYQAITKYGYSAQEALAQFKDKKKKDEAVEIEEAGKLAYDLVKDPKQLREILSDLNINTDFIELPMKLEYPDMGDDTEPPVKFIITAAPALPIEQIKELFVKDWDKGGRSYPMDLKTIRQIAERPENQEPEPDLWDLASTPNKQTRALNKGTIGKWQELTKGEILEVLEYMENDDRYKGIALVDKYLAPQTFQTRNPLVGKALRDFDPEVAVKATKNKFAHNGIAYQIFVPEDPMMKKPPLKGHQNPYKTLTTTW